MSDPDLVLAIDDGVAILTLNRPESRNALSYALRTHLRERMHDLDSNSAVRAIVLTGADPAFCAGVDVREFDSPDHIADLTGNGEPFFTSSTPVIGAINGPAYTGGLELALACHFRLASDRAVFADTHAHLGFTPGRGLTVLLTDAVGSARARQLALTGEPILAATALAWGLVNEVVPHDTLLHRAHTLARSIAAHNPDASRRINETFNAQADARGSEAWAIESSGFMGPQPHQK